MSFPRAFFKILLMSHLAVCLYLACLLLVCCTVLLYIKQLYVVPHETFLCINQIEVYSVKDAILLSGDAYFI